MVFALAATMLVASGCGSGAELQAERACGQAVIEDWADGRIDGTYPAPCYVAALGALPEDVRAYTTAKDDISRELNSSRGGP